MLKRRIISVGWWLAVLLWITSLALGQENEDVITYIIQPGDTLSSIAQRFNTTTSILAAENGIVNSSSIYWGQTLRIPVSAETNPPAPTMATIPYTVQPGDTLYRIAVRNQTTVSVLLTLNPNIRNSNVVFVGQQINIPDPNAPEPAAEVTAEVETAPETPSETTAEATAEVTEALVPTAAVEPTTTATSEPTAEPTPMPPTAEPTQEPTTEPAPEMTAEVTAEATAEMTAEAAAAIVEREFGLEVNLAIEDPTAMAANIGTLGVGWAKQMVYWREIEPEAGEINFDVLDAVIAALEAQNVQIMLTITTAPDWTRTLQEENGPPDDFAAYADFAGILASRYQGRVAAYQIWSEPNLRSRWKSDLHPISATAYMDLLRQAQAAIRENDTDALVISAGLAPTGFNDAAEAQGSAGVNAIDDRNFLSALYAGGLSEVVDAVGAHPIGWANPPDAVCCDQTPGVETHFEDPHFYFLNTLQAYRQIQLENGDTNTPLWVTRFGWGTTDDLGPPDEIHIFTSYTSLEEQALYLIRAFEIGAELGYVGPMFAYNLNGCQPFSSEGPSSCYYSLLGPQGEPRPAYVIFQSLDKSVSE
jgi:polysaccharide biosynthesis protein PslG